MTATPFETDPSVVKLSGTVIPGNVVGIRGANRAFEWKVQKGTGSSGASTIFSGALLTEGFEVVTTITTAAEYIAIVNFRDYVAPKKDGDKPPTFTIDNVLINFNKITSASIKSISQPDPKDDLSYAVIWTFIEYKKSVDAKTGKADPANPDGSKPGAADPQVAALQKTRDELADKIRQAS